MDDSHARILIVDDQPANVRLLEQILRRAGYDHIVSTTDPRLATSLVVTSHPDVILLDLHMPHLDGFAVLRELRSYLGQQIYLPVLVLTADAAAETRQRALSSGAKDFLVKPFDTTEVVLRIRNLLETRRLHLALREENARLEERVRERTREFEEAQSEILERLAQAAEFHDDETGLHTRRVGQMAATLAAALDLPPETVEHIRRTAPLHDVGKIAIPDSLLLKAGPLDPGERSLMQRHTVLGARILSGGRSELIRVAERIALSHHERWDGGGYPAGLQGEEIPLAARIVAVADVFDALAHERPYRKAWPVERVVEEVETHRGSHFDPRVVDAFRSCMDEGLLSMPRPQPAMEREW